MIGILAGIAGLIAVIAALVIPIERLAFVAVATSSSSSPGTAFGSGVAPSRTHSWPWCFRPSSRRSSSRGAFHLCRRGSSGRGRVRPRGDAEPDLPTGSGTDQPDPAPGPHRVSARRHGLPDPTIRSCDARKVRDRARARSHPRRVRCDQRQAHRPADRHAGDLRDGQRSRRDRGLRRHPHRPNGNTRRAIGGPDDPPELPGAHVHDRIAAGSPGG